MRLKRLGLAALAAGMLLGVTPLASAPASAGHCPATIRLFFWYGYGVVLPGDEEATTVGQPVAFDHGEYLCVNTHDAPVQFNTYIVLPGQLLVIGRDEVAACQDITGNVQGLGVDKVGKQWRYPRDPVDGSCNAAVGTNGARSPRYVMSPADVTGSIRGWTGNGQVIYQTALT